MVMSGWAGGEGEGGIGRYNECKGKWRKKCEEGEGRVRERWGGGGRVGVWDVG